MVKHARTTIKLSMLFQVFGVVVTHTLESGLLLDFSLAVTEITTKKV